MELGGIAVGHLRRNELAIVLAIEDFGP